MRAFWIAAAFAVAMLAAFTVLSPATTASRAESVAKIVYDNSHGSAVHIGDGYFLTAAHVVDKNETAPLVFTDGREVLGDVLWTNRAYDIALVKASASGIAAAKLACVVPDVGTHIHAKGNPSNMDFITVWGRVAGAERTAGPWHSVIVTDIATVPGQSGGPVFNDQGEVVGITVGVMLAPAGMGRSIVGIGYVVPGRAVCDLLAR
ncbi:serine protease [Falsochrobactrum shanghaiense]|uniref:Serine protease n=1 Tax=Falsochrobactrum shanghaiense TaxID=2201899 RepID=A0A316JC09_9HYPH|nr:serine protease [Falsochrobactrum shanghaiense]PWL18808.1 serine protease [Falsochrobactrum shanghaiense]